MGKQHCKDHTAAKAFMKGLRKPSKHHTFINHNIKKKKNKDGSYLVTWRTNYRL
jgi:hypothetical protein